MSNIGYSIHLNDVKYDKAGGEISGDVTIRGAEASEALQIETSSINKQTAITLNNTPDTIDINTLLTGDYKFKSADIQMVKNRLAASRIDTVRDNLNNGVMHFSTRHKANDFKTPLTLGMFGDEPRVGINTTYPQYTLDVSGDVYVKKDVRLLARSTEDDKVISDIIFDEGDIGLSNMKIRYDGTLFNDNNKIYIGDYTTDAKGITVTKGGRVGIGNTTPSYTLDVSGTIYNQIKNGYYNNRLTNILLANKLNTLKIDTISPDSTYGKAIFAIRNGAGIDEYGDAITISGKSGSTSGTFVGIGKTTPSYTLDVSGRLRVGSAVIQERHTDSKDFVIINSALSGVLSNTKTDITNNYAFRQTDIGETFVNASSGKYISFRINDGEHQMMTINSTGVGIGKTDPSYTLDVNGSCRASRYYGTGDNDTFIQTESNRLRFQTGSGRMDTTYSSSAQYIQCNNSIGFSAIGSGNKAVIIYPQNYNTDGTATVLTANGNIHVGGRIGIGTTSPSYTLHANGTIFNQVSNGTYNVRQNNILLANNLNTLKIDTINPETNYGKAIFAIRSGSGSTSFSDAITISGKSGSNYGAFVGIGTTSPSQALDVDGNIHVGGRIGIGRSPGYELDVNGKFVFRNTNDTVNDYIITDYSTTRTELRIRHDGREVKLSSGDAPYVGTVTNHDFRILANNSTRMLINTSGYVGIGTTSPSQKLHVDGNVFVSGTLNIGDSDTGLDQISDGVLALRTNNSTRMLINTSGYVGIGTTSPAYTLHATGTIYNQISNGTYNVRQNNILLANNLNTLKIDTINPNSNYGNAFFAIRSGSGSTSFSDAITISGRAYSETQYGTFVGIGTTTPDYMLDVNGSTRISGGLQIYDTKPYNDLSNAFQIKSTHNYSVVRWALKSQYQDNGSNPRTSLLKVYCRYGSTGTWYQVGYFEENYIGIRGFTADVTLTDTTFNFTGQHHNYSVNEDIDADLKGFIVVSTGSYRNQMNHCDECNKYKITINESLPIVDLSKKSNDKKVFGVISDKDDYGTEKKYKHGNFVSVLNTHTLDRPLTINSIGEGAIWVCNVNGVIENGDYITSSPIPGLGMIQNDDLLHNYTVAKSTMDCLFSGEQVPQKKLRQTPVMVEKQEPVMIIEQIQQTDGSGNIVTDESGNPIMIDHYDESGNPVMIEQKDASNNVVKQTVYDESGNPIMVQDKIANGVLKYDPVVDEKGNFIYDLIYDDSGNQLYTDKYETKYVEVFGDKYVIYNDEEKTEEYYTYEFDFANGSLDQQACIGNTYIMAFIGCTYHCG